MTNYQFTEEDYTAIAKAVRESDDWRDKGTREWLTLELDSPNISMTITRYVDGHHEVGCIYDGAYGREEELLYVVDGEHYVVWSFEFFDADGNDQPSDFDARHLCEILNWPKNKRRAA